MAGAMKSLTWIKAVFWTSALYDLLLGLAFLFAADALFERAGVPVPNHPGYIQFPALILVLFGIMFARIAQDPIGQRDCMLYGIGLKLAYSGVVLFHQFTGGVPSMWLPFAYIDILFLIGFLAAWTGTRTQPSTAGS